MKLSQIINSDSRVAGVNEEIQRYLQKIPAISKKTNGERPSQELIEKCIAKITKKYNTVFMQAIFLTVLEEDEIPWYSASIIDRVKSERVCTVYGLTLYEVTSKVLLSMFAYIRKGEQ